MTYFVSHITALRFLLRHRSGLVDQAFAHPLSPTRSRPKAGAAPNLPEAYRNVSLSRLLFASGDAIGFAQPERLHLNVAEKDDVRKSRRATCHIWRGADCRNYLRLNKDVCVLSPEGCFLQLAAELPLAQVVELGFLLCGTYAPESVCPGVKGELSPLTTVKKLRGYLGHAEGLSGAKKARQALRYVREGSASSMESKIGALLCLPTSQGGCSTNPLLNEEIVLSPQARGFNWCSVRKPDFFWPSKGVALDYDSSTWHDERERADHDERRRNELAAMGISDLVCRAKDFRTVTGTSQLVGQLLAALDRPMPRAKNYDEKQRLLFDLLFGSMRWELANEPPKLRGAKSYERNRRL